jgi:hypothetical protein
MGPSAEATEARYQTYLMPWRIHVLPVVVPVIVESPPLIGISRDKHMLASSSFSELRYSEQKMFFQDAYEMRAMMKVRGVPSRVLRETPA